MEDEASRLERRHVHQVYESTAPYFSGLQSRAWPRVRQFLLEQEPGSLVADIGCGTGKYLSVNSEVYTLGCDYCRPMVEVARKKGCEVTVCDNLSLPFRDQGFDAVISVGVIHHFCTKRRRVRAVEEMSRVLAPGGRILIYAWAMEQKNRRFQKQDVFVPWNRALCSRLLLAAGPSGARVLPPGRPGAPPQADHPQSPAGRQPGPEWRRSRSLDGYPSGGCCGQGPGADSGSGGGFYSSLGRSFRAWLLPRASTEEEEEPPPQSEGQQEQGVTILAQPAGHRSSPRGPPSIRPDDDDDVFVPSKAAGAGSWPNQPDTLGQRDGPPRGRSPSPGEPRRSGQGWRWERSSVADSPGSIPDPSGPPREQPLDTPAVGAFMRYYHVFREGELRRLLEENVADLRVLSSGHDHGNWCVVAEKRRDGAASWPRS
ncbi:probable tRNA methyltransferase 9B [Tachyglossus aculeatus]|uniref:probable tRNA methyltransferase 9B n=1 Tax=Tachyglossus aculeatus TaxID=9261 RepID=UPI0018F31BE0|nr:probable tRNA methyltransferase 9B [Tachyglossus aculeatus]XP_038625228.1 probable tRNA methyltransferase 9B [Tachyglossus aculeatus]